LARNQIPRIPQRSITASKSAEEDDAGGKDRPAQSSLRRKFPNPPNREELIEKGEIGSFLWSVDPVQLDRYQHLAVEKSRLHIRLLFGYDVIHGFRTVFPVPIAMAASWIRRSGEGSVVCGAGSSRQRINWTFGPMVDIARERAGAASLKAPAKILIWARQ